MTTRRSIPTTPNQTSSAAEVRGGTASAPTAKANGPADACCPPSELASCCAAEDKASCCAAAATSCTCA